MICLLDGYEENVVSFCLHIFFVGLVVDCGYCNTWSKYMKRKTDFLPTWGKRVFKTEYNIYNIQYTHLYNIREKITKCPNVQNVGYEGVTFIDQKSSDKNLKKFYVYKILKYHSSIFASFYCPSYTIFRKFYFWNRTFYSTGYVLNFARSKNLTFFAILVYVFYDFIPPTGR